MKRVVAAFGGVTLIAGALMVAPVVAQASSQTPAAQTPAAQTTAAPAVAGQAPELTAIQRDLHLTAAAAKARLVSDGKARTTALTLQARLGSNFGGSWLDKSGKLVVGTTVSSETDLIRSMGAKVEVVARSSSQLDAIRAKLDHHSAKAGAGVHSWYVDPVTNAVVVNADSVAKGKSFATAAGASPSGIRTVVSSREPRPMSDVRGGDQYSRPVTGGLVLCSVGFSVVGGFVTAGHCGTAGDSTLGFDNSAQGTYQASTFPGNDYAWVKVNSNWTPQPWVNNYSGGNVGVAGSQEAAIGAAVCRSGRTTGWRCGVIQAKNVTINYSAGAVYGMTQSNACAEGGDSGGSWISGDQAQGTTSGGSGNCTDGGTMFFQPINATLSHYGLTLVTTANNSTGHPIVGFAGKCIDIPGSNTTDGTQLQLWDCNGTGAQSWTFASDGTLRALGKCMDVPYGSTANGALIQLVGCNGNPAQQFVLSSAGDLVNPQANKCVDVLDFNSNSGAKLQQWDCAGTANQKWHIG